MIDTAKDLRKKAAEELYKLSGPHLGKLMGEYLSRYPGYSADEMELFRKSIDTRWRVLLTTLATNHVLSKVSGEDTEANVAELLGDKFTASEMMFICNTLVMASLKIAFDLDLITLNKEPGKPPLVR